MKKFKFSLDAVLRWKQALEEEALKALGQAAIARQQAQARLAQAKEKLQELLQTVKEARAERMPVGLQVSYLQEIKRQEDAVKAAQQGLQEALQQENKAKNTYLVKKRETETITKLRSKREDLYKKHTAILLERELEEIMLSRKK